MKCLYWNIKGIANSPSRLALKNLLLAYKPNLIFIIKPWILFEQFPRNWFHKLHYKLSAINSRQNLIPSLWCFCIESLNPNILALDEQHVTFSITDKSTIYIFLQTISIEDSSGKPSKSIQPSLVHHRRLQYYYWLS